MGNCIGANKKSTHSTKENHEPESLNPVDKAIMQHKVLIKKAQTAPKLTLENNAMYRSRRQSE